jgi:hypothetical protein
MFERIQRVSHTDHEPNLYPTEIEPLMQSLLSTLADIDFEYEQEQKKLRRSAADPDFKARMSRRLEGRHRVRRRPYIQELNRLHGRVRQVLKGQ